MKRLLIILALALPISLSAQELPLGNSLPLASESFPATDGTTRPLSAYGGDKGTVLVFWSNKCVWVNRYEARMLDLAARYAGQGYNFVLVNSLGGDNESPEKSAARAAEGKYTMPYIDDAGGRLASALGAARAPQVFVFDSNRSLTYVGAIDDQPSDPAAVSQHFLRDALDAGLKGQPARTTRSEALGCLISN